MRMMVKAVIPVEAGNEAIRDGGLPKTIQSAIAELKPEAKYFLTENGKRTMLLFFDMLNASQMVSVAEPFFFPFKAGVEFTPAMSPEDLMKAGSAMEQAAKKHD